MMWSLRTRERVGEGPGVSRGSGWGNSLSLRMLPYKSVFVSLSSGIRSDDSFADYRCDCLWKLWVGRDDVGTSRAVQHAVGNEEEGIQDSARWIERFEGQANYWYRYRCAKSSRHRLDSQRRSPRQFIRSQHRVDADSQ